MTAHVPVFIMLLLMFLAMLITPIPHAGHAQDDPTPAPITIVHVVQQNETLSEIAQLYNTSVEAIMTMNQISDARFIDVGQRLVIPAGAQVPISGADNVHVVIPGDDLQNIAARYGIPPSQIISAHGILHPSRLYLGQALAVGEMVQQDTEYTTVTVQPGDNALRIAARFGMTTAQFYALNGLTTLGLIPGQTVIVRGSTENPSNKLLRVTQLTPQAPIQGQSIALRFHTDTPVQVSGVFMNRDLQSIQLSSGDYATVLGVHSLSAPGVYRVELQLTDEANRTTRHELRFRVLDGGYGSELITIPPERSNLLEPSLVQAELDQVATVMTGFTAQQYFTGAMSLPSSGPITSQYGTRRSYNGSPIDNNFHGGTDFGGATGSPITAPAEGVVVLAQPLDVRGNAVILDHGLGIYSGYWHLSEIAVAEGQQLARGELLGLLGNTGLVTGAHLHWEMWVHGVQVNPMQWTQQVLP